MKKKSEEKPEVEEVKDLEDVESPNSWGMKEDRQEEERRKRRNRICSTPGCGTFLRENNPYDKCSPCMEGKRLGTLSATATRKQVR